MEHSVLAPQWGRGRKYTFYGLVGLYTLIMVTPMSLLPFAVLAWFLETEAGTTSHRVHEVTFGTIFVLAFVGLIAQYRKPHLKVAPAQQLFIPIAVLFLVQVAVGGLTEDIPFILAVFVLPPLLILSLHPARREIVSPSVHPSRILLGMAVVAAVPLLWFAVNQVVLAEEATELGQPIFEELEATVPEDAPEEVWESTFLQLVSEADLQPEQVEAVEHSGHWTAIAAFALAVVALAFLSALRIRGWRLTAWTTGLGLAYFGVASALTPDDASSAGILWGLLAVVWGVVFVFLAEQEHRDEVRGSAEHPT